MFYQGLSLVTVKESLVIDTMLLLSWCFIKTYHLILSRNLLQLSQCSCCHGVLSRHITCHYQGLSCICHDAPVAMVFIKTYRLSLRRNHLYLSWCSCWHDVFFFKTKHLFLSRKRLISCNCHDASVVMMFYQGISHVIVKESLVIVIMLLLSCFIKTFHLFFVLSPVFIMMILLYGYLSRHITCHGQCVWIRVQRRFQ